MSKMHSRVVTRAVPSRSTLGLTRIRGTPLSQLMQATAGDIVKLDRFLSQFGICEFQNHSLLLRALTHSSFSNWAERKLQLKPRTLGAGSLELLGDRVIGAAIALQTHQWQCANNTSLELKSMSRWTKRFGNRSVVQSLVGNQGFAYVATEFGMDQLVRWERCGNEDERCLAGVFEAVCGAIYLGGGWKDTQKIAEGVVKRAEEVQKRNMGVEEWAWELEKVLSEWGVEGGLRVEDEGEGWIVSGGGVVWGRGKMGGNKGKVEALKMAVGKLKGEDGDEEIVRGLKELGVQGLDRVVGSEIGEVYERRREVEMEVSRRGRGGIGMIRLDRERVKECLEIGREIERRSVEKIGGEFQVWDVDDVVNCIEGRIEDMVGLSKWWQIRELRSLQCVGVNLYRMWSVLRSMESVSQDRKVVVKQCEERMKRMKNVQYEMVGGMGIEDLGVREGLVALGIVAKGGVGSVLAWLSGAEIRGGFEKV